MSCPTLIELSYYMPLIALSILLLSLYITLKYMAAKAFKIPEWEAYFSVELYELFFSIVIALAAIGAFRASEMFSCAVAGGSDPIDAATAFITKILNDVMSGMSEIFSIQVCLSILNTFQRRIGEYVLTVTYKVFPGIDSYVSVTNALGFGLVTVFGSLSAQVVLLVMIKATMATFFLPLGIILRFFSITRETGVFLIVLAISMQVVFPTIYIITEQILKEIHFEFPLYEKGVFTTSTAKLASICGGKYALLGFAGSKFAIGGMPVTPGSIPFIGPAFSMIFQEFGIGMIMPIEFKEFMQSLAVLSLPAFFLPAFAVMLTIAFINGVTKFLLTKVT